MRRNLLKQRLRRGELVIGTMIQEMREPAIAQILKVTGYDFFMIDMEHGSYNLADAANLLRAGRLLDLYPLVRIISPEYHLIAGPLDQGAMGIMLPRVEQPEQLKTLVECMKYPPAGKRGCSSDAPHAEYVFGDLRQFLEENNEDTLVIAQIERKAAIDNIDALLDVPGVDVAFIGPEDLSVSLGVPGETEHPLVVGAIETVLAAAQKRGLPTGTHTWSLQALKHWIDRGMRMILYSSDVGFLMEGSAAGLNELRGHALQAITTG
jgi:2-dehydro-3-deoxyglucarate aldolase/4-hydroxy-2-oxoheptanedioate aldolase